MHGGSAAGRSLGGASSVVEDTFVVADLLGQVLAECGYTILGLASSGEQALVLLASEPPDVAVLDLELGGHSAAPVAEVLRAGAVPFVLVTGYEVPPEPALCEAPCVGKPFRIEELVHAVARAERRAPRRDAVR
jgi:DNA-binding response OmpR family regulator